MTDTSRSLADIKTLFADNAVGQISPQDLRDFVESVADPVVGGGFDAAPPLQERQMTFLRNNAAGLTGLTVPASGADTWTHVTGDWVFLSPDPTLSNVHPDSRDPGGWHDAGYSLSDTDPRSAYVLDIPAGGALTLPPGTFLATCFVIIDTDLDTADTQAINLYCDQMEYGDSFTYVPGDPWIYESYWAARQLGSPTGTPYPDFTPPFGRYNGTIAIGGSILVNDNPDPAPFNWVFSLFNTLADVKVVYYSMVTTRIAGAGW